MWDLVPSWNWQGWNGVTAVATVLLFLVTLALTIVTGILACVANNQIKALRQSNKKQLQFLRQENIRSRTLAACERYDLDPVLDKAVRVLRKAKSTGELGRFPGPYRHEMYTVLNYLEQLAIGAKRGVYDEKIILDYMEYIAAEHLENLLGPFGRIEQIEEDTFLDIKNLCAKWSEQKRAGREENASKNLMAAG